MNVISNWQEYLEAHRNTRTKTVDPNDDPSFSSKVSHVMKRGEKLMEFISRTGLSRAQAMEMSRDEISRFANQADQRAADEISVPVPMKVSRMRTRPSPPLVMVG